MPLAYWNAARTLFWIIIRQRPTDLLLDKDNELALAAALLSSKAAAQFSPRSNVLELIKIPLNFDLVKTPSAQAIADATDHLSAALRTSDVICRAQ
jgi:hypothetical protein